MEDGSTVASSRISGYTVVEGHRAMPTLALVRGGELIASYRLDKPVVVAGRDDECDITLSGPLVSREHCRFVASGDAYIVQDLVSNNGTYLNGERVERQILVEGDRIAVVPHILVYHAEDKDSLDAPVPPPGEARKRAMATRGVDADEVNRHLAKLHAEAEAYGFAVTCEAIGGDVDLVKVAGPIDARTSDGLGKAIGTLLAEGRCRIVVDMAEASYLTSEGVDVLLSAADKAEAGGGKLVLLNPVGQVQKILKLGLSGMFTIAGDRQEALSVF
jgi:anti-anti-sigma factor